MTSSLSQAATRDQLKTPNFIPSNSSAQASVSSKIKDSEQRPPRKRQKILPSSPFRFESPQPCNSQSSKAASMEQTVTDKSPAPRSIQGMEAEWPKRGRTNTRGRAPLAAPEYSTPRSQNENISGLSKSCSRARSVSLDTAKRLLRTAGMILPYDDLHRFPSNMDPYLECLREMPNQATPLTLKSKVVEFTTAHRNDDISFIVPDVVPYTTIGDNLNVHLNSEKIYYKPTAEDNDPERMKLGFDALMKIQKEAHMCWNHDKDENGWCYGVIWPLLNMALHKPESSIWTVECVKWQTINSSFMLVDSGESADDFQKKKIDFAIFLNPTSKNSDVEALYALYNALQQDIGEAFRGLWTDTFTSTLIPFLLIEVEPDDQKEAEVKLMTAASAFLNYLLHLLEEKASRSAMDPKFKTSLQQRLPPAFSWLVQGHKWKFYICYRIHDGHFVGRFVWVPCSKGDGSTRSGWEAVRLLQIIEAVKAGAGEQYLAWLMELFGLKPQKTV